MLRNLLFDIAKVIAILWIVSVLHVYDYNSSYKEYVYNDYTYMITRMMLGVFMFSLGYFMSKYEIHSWKEFKQYYINII